MSLTVKDGLLEAIITYKNDLNSAVEPLKSKVEEEKEDNENLSHKFEELQRELAYLSQENSSRLFFSDIDVQRISFCCSHHEREFYKVKTASCEKMISFLEDEINLTQHAINQIQEAIMNLETKIKSTSEVLSQRRTQLTEQLEGYGKECRATAQAVAQARTVAESLRDELQRAEGRLAQAGVEEARSLLLGMPRTGPVASAYTPAQ